MGPNGIEDLQITSNTMGRRIGLICEGADATFFPRVPSSVRRIRPTLKFHFAELLLLAPKQIDDFVGTMRDAVIVDFSPCRQLRHGMEALILDLEP
jgi:hypothetical protein